MVQISTLNVIVLLSAVQIATASLPKRSFLNFQKRQSTCLGGVICEQQGDQCTTCSFGEYCVAVGTEWGCCPVGRVCGGAPPPCVDAGKTAPEPTEACPTRAPICTTTNGVPLCSGNITDWLTMSNTASPPKTTTPPAVTTTPSTTTTTTAYTPPTSEEPEPTYATTTTTPIYTPPVYTTTTAAPTYPSTNGTTTTPPVPTYSGGAEKVVAGSAFAAGLGFIAAFLL